MTAQKQTARGFLENVLADLLAGASFLQKVLEENAEGEIEISQDFADELSDNLVVFDEYANDVFDFVKEDRNAVEKQADSVRSSRGE